MLPLFPLDASRPRIAPEPDVGVASTDLAGTNTDSHREICQNACDDVDFLSQLDRKHCEPCELSNALQASEQQVHFDVLWARVLRTGHLSDIALSASIQTYAGVQVDLDQDLKTWGWDESSASEFGREPLHEIGLLAPADVVTGRSSEETHETCLGPCSGQEPWLESVVNILGEGALCQRLHEVKEAHRSSGSDAGLTYGSDCSGVDAPAVALKSLIKRLQPQMEDLLLLLLLLTVNAMLK